MIDKSIKSENLTKTHSKIAAEWHSTANGSLTPEQVSRGSRIKAWWQCPNNKDHIWQTSVKSRTKGSRCPFCIGKNVDDSNCLATTHREIAAEWHPEKNGDLTPKQVTAGSNKNIWWQCKYDKEHSWPATISNRVGRNSKCPYCANRKVDDSNCLATTHREIAAEWHPKKNGDLTPKQVTAGSNKNIWWQCLKNKNHEWQAKVYERKHGNKNCFICKSLATTHRELAAEWHPTANGTLTPEQVSKGNHLKVWWLCNNNHAWEAQICQRTRKSKGYTNCPKCFAHSSEGEQRIASELKIIFPSLKQRKKISGYEADIYIEQLKLVIEFDGSYYHQNRHIKDEKKDRIFKDSKLEIIRLRGQKLKATSEAVNINVNCNNIKLSDIQNLLEIIKNQYNSSLNIDQINKIEQYLKRSKKESFWNETDFEKLRTLIPGKHNNTNLADHIHRLSALWHPSKNSRFQPQNFSIKSGQKVWWQCKKNDEHEWQCKICYISNGTGCPFCSGKRINHTNCLAKTHPEIAKEWDEKKNGELTPHKIGAGSNKKVWWTCLIGHSYDAPPDQRTRSNTNCPFCSNRRIGNNNCLATTHRELAAEWHLTKNKLTPNEVIATSKKTIWWQCLKDKNHEWQKSLIARTRGSKCPLCKSLANTHPQLADEWNKEKNGNFTPNDFTYGSKTKIWWNCPKSFDHTYQSTILSRSSGHGCSKCSNIKKKDRAIKRWEKYRLQKKNNVDSK